MRKPNIVFVLTDDQGYGDLGCTGNEAVKTPNIDMFFEESTHLTNFHVGPTCAPTRSGLMSGHYANSAGVWHTVGGRSLLREEEWTLPQALKESGYTTGIFGKWHLGDEYPYRPKDRGFDEAIVHGGGGISQAPDYWGNDYFDDTYYVNNVPKPFKGYCTDVFFREGLSFIEKNATKPFFCYIACNAPHSPYNVDKKYSDLYKDEVPFERAKFYGMITNIDENFGRLKEKLEELKILDDTILIFMTDNGTSKPSKMDQNGFMLDSNNAGLRGMKNSEYDGGHRVPFFMSYPNGGVLKNRDIDMITANVDFMPTLLDFCDVEIKDHKFHGQSIKPWIVDEKKEEINRVLVTDSQRVAYPIKWRKSAVMTNRWRLVNGYELYDMNVDREQRNDVSYENMEVVKELRGEYDKWWDIVSEQFDVDIPIHIGNYKTSFTTHDLRNAECDTAWNQAQIRKGQQARGYFEIEVDEDGDYEISLSRWPSYEDRAINKGIDGFDHPIETSFISRKEYDSYYGGIALDFKKINVKIQGVNLSNEIDASASKASLKVTLKKGQTKLVANFLDKDNKEYAAYFIEIAKI
jgi:arylsulfatase A-like enzyme